MGHKLRSLLLILLLIVPMACGLTACGQTESKTQQEDTAEEEVHVHSFGEWVTVEEVTCEKIGKQERECECGEKETKIIYSAGHTVVRHTATAAGCEDGNIEYWECTVCGTLYKDAFLTETATAAEVVLPKIGHRLVTVAGKAATCTEEGILKHWYCTACKKTFSDSAGTKETDNITVVTMSHTLEKVEAKEATCTETGWTEHYLCTVCKGTFDENGQPTETIETEKLPHSFNDLGECQCGEKNYRTITYVANNEIIVRKEELNALLRPFFPTADGYFIGWYRQNDAPWYFDTDTVTETMTLQAKFLSFDNDFVLLPYSLNGKETFSLPEYQIDGYTCAGICTDTESGEIITKKSEYEQPYYSKWIPKKYVLTVDADGGIIEGEEKTRTATQEITYRTAFDLPVPTKSGFVFSGWSVGEKLITDADGRSLKKFGETADCDAVAVWEQTCEHLMTAHEAVQARCLTEGSTAYYECAECSGKFEDEEGKTECITVVVPATGHHGGYATCLLLAVCSDCSASYGDYADHAGGNATCKEKAVCSLCGINYGEFADHTGGTATCDKKAVCTVCGQSYGAEPTHTGGNATCKERAVCTVCKQPYGEYVSQHSYHNHLCTVCGTTDGLSYTLNQVGDGYEITNLRTEVTDLVIPPCYNGLPVTDVASGAFYGKTFVTVSMPNTMRSVGEDGFSDCKQLTEVKITDLDAWRAISFGTARSNPLFYAKKLTLNGKAVTDIIAAEGKISDYCFYNLVGVQSVTLSSHEVTVGRDAFYGFTSSTKLNLFDATEDGWDKRWNENCSATVSYAVATASNEDYTYNIYKHTVYLTEYLGKEEEVTVPETLDEKTVVSVGQTFASSAIKRILLPKTVLNVTAKSFNENNSELVVLFDGSRAEWVQNGNADLSFVAYRTEQECVHDGFTYWYLKTEEEEQTVVFLTAQIDEEKEISCLTSDLLCAVCGAKLSIVSDKKRAHNYENGICTVCNEEEGSTNLLFVCHEDGTASVSAVASWDGKLVIPSIYDGHTVTAIAENAFRGTGVTEIVLPESIEIIGNNAFSACEKLEKITYYAKNCRLDGTDGAFVRTEKSAAVELLIGEKVTSVPAFLFKNSAVHEVTWGGAEKIGVMAFAFSEIELETIAVKEIAYAAFYGCEITNLTVQECEKIGCVAFGQCGLKQIVLTEKVAYVEIAAFIGNPDATVLCYDNAQYWHTDWNKR